MRTHGDNMAKVSLAEASRGRTRLERSPHSQPRCCFAVHTAAQPHAKRQRESRVARRTFPCSSSISSLLSPRCSFPRTGEYTAETRKGMKTMQNFVTYRRGRLQRTRGGARGRTQLQARGGEKERQNAPFSLSPLPQTPFSSPPPPPLFCSGIFVDWTTRATVQRLPFKNWIFLCFRTFSASRELHESDDDVRFYEREEKVSPRRASSPTQTRD